MVIVVYGGNASGKSALAEELAEKLSARQRDASEAKVYLATMQRDGSPEAEERIAKHRSLREGKGFVTVECPENLPFDCTLPKDASVVLLEDVGNLVANELFGNGKSGQSAAEEVTQAVTSEIEWLLSEAEHTVVVTNNIFDGGIEIEETMRRYTEVLGAVNQWLAKRCGVFVESVCGLPHVLKGQPLFEEINR